MDLKIGDKVRYRQDTPYFAINSMLGMVVALDQVTGTVDVEWSGSFGRERDIPAGNLYVIPSW